MLGAQQTLLMQIRRDHHPHWMMFVLHLVPYSEAYSLFLRHYTQLSVTDARLRKWIDTKTNAETGISACSVNYGENMRGVETAQHVDPSMAREEASFLAMVQVQSQYPHCYLLTRPADDTEAMTSFVRIHSSFSDEFIRETKEGNLHQWIFRNMVLAEGYNRGVSSDKILTSMETIVNSHIQRHVTMSAAFASVLQGTDSPPAVSDAPQEPPTQTTTEYLPPTVENLRQHKRGPVARPPPASTSTSATPSASAATAIVSDFSSDTELNEDSAFNMLCTMGISPQTVTIPPHSEQNSATLLVDVLKKSIYHRGDELSSTTGAFLHKTPHGTTLPIFECRLTFKGHQFAKGRGDTRRRALEVTSHKALARLNEALAALTPQSMSKLVAVLATPTT